MRDLDRFVDLVRDELGLSVSSGELDRSFDELDRWDSVQMLRFIGVLEEELGRQVPVPAVIRAGSLREVYDVVAGG